MFSLRNDIQKLVEALIDNRPLRANCYGEWAIEDQWFRTIKGFLGIEKRRFRELARAFYLELIDLERDTHPLHVGLFAEAADLIVDRLVKDDPLAFQILRAKFALLYRTGVFCPSEASSSHFEALSLFAREWKFASPVFHDDLLSSSDIINMQKVCQRAEIAEILLLNGEFLHDFFNWTLRDGNSVEVFLEFPGIQQRITESLMSGRIGRMGGEKLLRVQEIDGEKVVTLMFEGKEINILDENRSVVLKNDYVLKIAEIYDSFKYKAGDAGHLEVMQQGVMNWSPLRWGFWNPRKNDYDLIDLENPDWYKELPVHEVLSLKEARAKYGNHLNGAEWNLSSISTRTRENLDFEGAHSYMSLAVPQGDGSYSILPLGKNAFTYAPSLLKAFLNLAETVDGSIAYPDENVYYTHRQRTRMNHALTSAQAQRFLESVRRDMKLSREGNLVYQIQTENCAKWTFEKLEAVFGNEAFPALFNMNLLDSTPRDFMGTLFNFLRSLPELIRVPFAASLHLLFGAAKGKWVLENGQVAWKSMTHHSFWEDLMIFHPSMLYVSLEKGLAKRAIRAGVRFLGRFAVKLKSVLAFELKIFVDEVFAFDVNQGDALDIGSAIQDSSPARVGMALALNKGLELKSEYNFRGFKGFFPAVDGYTEPIPDPAI